MSKKLIPGFDYAIEHKLSVRQMEIIKCMINHEKLVTASDLNEMMSDTSIKALHANLLKLCKKNVISIDKVEKCVNFYKLN